MCYIQCSQNAFLLQEKKTYKEFYFFIENNIQAPYNWILCTFTDKIMEQYKGYHFHHKHFVSQKAGMKVLSDMVNHKLVHYEVDHYWLKAFF